MRANFDGVPVYLDNHAITPVDPRVAETMSDEMMMFRGNANSVHHIHGEWASARLYRAAAAVGELVGMEADDVRFTSSATEALRLALAHAVRMRRGKAPRVAVSRIEHLALLDMVNQAEQADAIIPIWLECDDAARISAETVERALDAQADIVCLIAANNEVGTIQPLAEIAGIISDRGARLLLDLSQAAGRIEIDNQLLNADYLVISGHKMYGPSGIGALVGPDMLHSRFDWPIGGHEPTPNLPGAIGLAKACALRLEEMTRDEEAIVRLRDRLEGALLEAVPEIAINGDLNSRLAGNLHISARGAPNDQVVARLRGVVSISTGAACASGTDAPSHVLRAMRLPEWRQESALRIGVGKFNTEDEIDYAAAAIAQAIADVRRG